MSAAHEKEGGAKKQDVAQMHREMETRRLAMLRLIEESKAKLKTILNASQPKPPDPKKSGSKSTN